MGHPPTTYQLSKQEKMYGEGKMGTTRKCLKSPFSPSKTFAIVNLYQEAKSFVSKVTRHLWLPTYGQFSCKAMKAKKFAPYFLLLRMKGRS